MLLSSTQKSPFQAVNPSSQPWQQPQGNESRLTRYRAHYLHEISRVHGGALATPFDGTLIGDFAHEIEGEMANHGHVLGSVAYTQA